MMDYEGVKDGVREIGFLGIVFILSVIIGSTIIIANMRPSKQEPRFTSPYISQPESNVVIVTLKDGTKVRIESYKYIHTIKKITAGITTTKD